MVSASTASSRHPGQFAHRREATSVPVVRLWLAVLAGYLALGATLQVLPAFTTARFGAGPALVGLVIGVASLAAAVLRPVAGRTADAGRARAMVTAGAVLGVLGGLGHLWSPNLAVLVLARLLLGASEGAVFVAAVTWVLRDTPATRRGGVAGWFGLSMWGGLALGPVLAVGLTRLGGLPAVWAAVIALPATGAVLAVTTRPSPATPTPAAAVRVGARHRLLPVSARLPGLTLGLASYGYGTIAALLLLRLDHGGLGAHNVALTVFAAAFLLTRAGGSPLVNHYGGPPVAIVSSLIQTAGLLLIAAAGNQAIALAGVVISGAGVALLYPSMVAITLTRTPPAQHGAAVGVMTSFWDLAIVVAGPLGGLIANTAGYPAAFTLAAATAVTAALLVIALLRRPPTAIRSEARPTGEHGAAPLPS